MFTYVNTHKYVNVEMEMGNPLRSCHKKFSCTTCIYAIAELLLNKIYYANYKKKCKLIAGCAKGFV